MKIYRNKKDGKLYYLYLYSPRGYTGSWHEAVPIHGGKLRKVNPEDFVVVSEI